MSQELTVSTKLKPREERFCAEYIIDFAQSKAAIRAGVPMKGARVWACKRMKEPHIRAEIDRLQADALHELGVSAFSILRETAAVAHSNVLDYLPALGLEDSDLKKLTRKQGAAIREIEIEEFDSAPVQVETPNPAQSAAVQQAAAILDPAKPKVKRRITLKLAPKTPALDLLGKHANLWGGRDDDPNGVTQIINNQVNVTIRRVGA